ncbi:MAG: PEP-CTERM sorting domain-containing protein [Kiritimatiellaeota bacterium]|nr:PEP-CTERM sorting domain-containing protein [Kiritimatiellota bacterium]
MKKTCFCGALRKNVHVIFQRHHAVAKRRASGGRAEAISYLRKRMFLRNASLVAALLAVSSTTYADSIVCDSSGNLYDLNLTNGAATNKRTANLTTGTHYIDIAYVQNTLYAITTFGSTPGNSLVSVNPSTAGITTVGQLFTNSTVIEGDMAVDPVSGLLYAVNSYDHTLLQISLTTGAATTVGSLPATTHDDYSGLAFTPAGNLYVANLDSANFSLLQINKTDAAVLATHAFDIAPGTFSDVVGMEYDPSAGTLALVGGVNPNLYHIDPATAHVTLVGNLGLGFMLDGSTSGLVITAVPEPASLGLLGGVGALVMLCWRFARARRR